MINKNAAIQVSNARLIACIYFGLLAIVATIIIDTFLYLLGVGELIPTFWAVSLATVIAAVFGALFGKKIIGTQEKYLSHSFWWGFVMVIAALPVYDLGFFFLVQHHHPESFTGASFFHLLALYGVLMIYSFVLVGLWLAVAAGLAAMYLRSKLIYYLLETDEKEINDPIAKSPATSYRSQ